MKRLQRTLLIVLSLTAGILSEGHAKRNTRGENYDICIYGGSSAGIVAAWSAAQLGRSVVIVEQGEHLGGLTTGGLGFTDIGNKQVVKGVAKQFYRKVGEHYGRLEQWIFEPRVADSIMRSYLNHERITVKTGTRLEGAKKSGNAITSIMVAGPKGRSRISAKYFIDATYEGDLLAAAGVSHIVGREANKTYGETFNGVQLLDRHQLPDGIDPYKVKGDPSSGLLWGISDAPLAPKGSADGLVQAYNYRICLTSDPANMIPITEPANYDPERYELLIRLMEAQPQKNKLADYFLWNRMPNNKTDVNNRGGFSTDMIGMNHSYPEAGPAERQRIIDDHTDYTKGLLYFIGHDPRVPESIRTEMLQWGYPKDEYIDNGHWSPQLYVREGRRMISDYVVTQADCQRKRVPEDGVAMAAYVMDSHNCQRIVIEKDGKTMVKNEGNVEAPLGSGPYPISYRAVTAKRAECTNLLVPVCLSSSHIAFGSIRMEPVFMVLGQVSAIAASMAIDNDCGAVQDVDYAEINALIEKDPYLDGSTPDIIIDDTDEEVVFSDGWKHTGGGGYGRSCRDFQPSGSRGTASFPFEITDGGKYAVYSFQHMNNAKLSHVTDFVITSGNEKHSSTLNTKGMKPLGQTKGEWVLLGRYDFEAGSRGEVCVIARSNSKLRTRADAILIIKESE